MAQFFFHVRNGTTTVFKDETGDQLADTGEAMAQAAVIAQELAADDGQWRGYSVEVVEEHGMAIGRVKGL